jgi:hypothetical protein
MRGSAKTIGGTHLTITNGTYDDPGYQILLSLRGKF